eukprot:g21693.t1
MPPTFELTVANLLPPAFLLTLVSGSWSLYFFLHVLPQLQLTLPFDHYNAEAPIGKSHSHASLEYLSSTSWPVRLLDLELFMRSCPDAAFGMRRMRTAETGRGVKGCLERFGLRDVLPHAPVLGDEEQGSRGSVDQMLRSSDLLVCMWVSECSRLRAHYSKPVIFYSGFLLLNDQSFHPGHAWSEALFHFWQRLSDLFACDVLAAKDGTPVVGPPCLVLFEERPLAEVAYWQTGQRKPVVRPLSLYVRCLHDPENAKQEVLIIHRGRLTSDGTEAKALNAMKHAFYPYSFVDQEDGMPFASMAEFRSVVLLPWDLNLVMFHDLYAMAVPLFLPDRNGLHHTAFTFLSRFQKSLTTGMPFKERLPEMEEKERGHCTNIPCSCHLLVTSKTVLLSKATSIFRQETHPFSPFDFEYLEVREFWLDYTEYVTAPAILHFASLPDLLVQVYQLDAIKTHGRIRAHNARRLRESRNFWSNALQRLATPWAPWGGEHWDASCGAEHPLKPQGSVLWSPLDGAPWIHAAPSRAEPLLIMDGADGALSAAVREAVEEFQRRAKPSHSEVFAGALDWKAIHQRLKGCAGGRRVEKLRCLLVMERVRPFLPLLRLTDLVRKGRRQLSRLLDPEGSVALAIWRMRKCVVLLPEPGFQEVIAYHFPYLKLNNQDTDATMVGASLAEQNNELLQHGLWAPPNSGATFPGVAAVLPAPARAAPPPRRAAAVRAAAAAAAGRDAVRFLEVKSLQWSCVLHEGTTTVPSSFGSPPGACDPRNRRAAGATFAGRLPLWIHRHSTDRASDAWRCRFGHLELMELRTPDDVRCRCFAPALGCKGRATAVPLLADQWRKQFVLSACGNMSWCGVLSAAGERFELGVACLRLSLIFRTFNPYRAQSPNTSPSRFLQLRTADAARLLRRPLQRLPRKPRGPRGADRGVRSPEEVCPSGVANVATRRCSAFTSHLSFPDDSCSCKPPPGDAALPAGAGLEQLRGFAASEQAPASISGAAPAEDPCSTTEASQMKAAAGRRHLATPHCEHLLLAEGADG